MNKHTAETLKFYLGKEVYSTTIKSPFLSKFVILRSISMDDGAWVDSSFIKDLLCLCENIYPILKTADDLTDTDIEYCYKESIEMYGSFDKCLIGNDFLINSMCFDLEGPSTYFYLMEKGFGAVPNKESPTGYVDLFGMPCVTPKQVEEGGIPWD